MDHINKAFFVLFNALIGIGNSNGLFDNTVGEVGKLNFDIELIKGLFCSWIALIGNSVGFDNTMIFGAVVGKLGIGSRGNN